MSKKYCVENFWLTRLLQKDNDTNSCEGRLLKIVSWARARNKTVELLTSEEIRTALFS